MPSDAVLGALYDSYSYETNHLENIPEFVQRSLADLVRAFAPHRSLNRWLDVGFGAGTILVAAKRDGWEVHGLEKSRLAVVQARAAGFTEAREGDFLQSPYDVDSFDVVTLAGVVEHLVDPQPFFHQARRLLRPGGVLFVSTPNSRSLSALALGLRWSVVAPPEHLNLFSKSSLEMALRIAGFDDPLIRTEGFNPYEVVTRWRRSSPSTDTKRSEGDVRGAAEGAYALNAVLMRSSIGRGVKRLANTALTVTRLGDELKAWAPAR
jgi:SAM-dependent methyltransferase